MLHRPWCLRRVVSLAEGTALQPQPLVPVLEKEALQRIQDKNPLTSLSEPRRRPRSPLDTLENPTTMVQWRVVLDQGFKEALRFHLIARTVLQPQAPFPAERPDIAQERQFQWFSGRIQDMENVAFVALWTSILESGGPGPTAPHWLRHGSWNP